MRPGKIAVGSTVLKRRSFHYKKVSSTSFRQGEEYILDKHRDIDTADRNMLEYIHLASSSKVSTENISTAYQESTFDLLGTIGSFAPFHSQMQNMAITTSPEHSGANTTGEFHGKVTPPFETVSLHMCASNLRICSLPRSKAVSGVRNHRA